MTSWFKSNQKDPIFSSTHQKTPNLQEEILLQIPQCKTHLIDASEAIELASGHLNLTQVTDNETPLAMVIKIGQDLQWPVIKDEPVVKLNSRNYLFTLAVKDGEPLSYGVSFYGDQNDVVLVNSLELFDDFLRENSCFSESCDNKKVKNNGIDWREFAPKIEEYNNVVAKAIAGGTGYVIKGIFKCSNAYTNQVHKGGEIMITSTKEKSSSSKKNVTTKKNQINKNLHRVRKLSSATEKLSKTMLNGVGVVSSSVMAPIVKSKPGKAFFSMVPGEVLLASLDALNKVLDAVEAAERQTFAATSNGASRVVSERIGESAGVATKDVLDSVGHVAGTAWNVLKIRKALCPSSSIKSGIIKSVLKK